MRNINFPMNAEDYNNAEKELGRSIFDHDRLYNQVLDCNTCKANPGVVCQHCTQAMETMRGSDYPFLNMRRIRLQQKMDVFLLRHSQMPVTKE